MGHSLEMGRVMGKADRGRRIKQKRRGRPSLFKICGTSLLPEERTSESATIPRELVCLGAIYIPLSAAQQGREVLLGIQRKGRAEREEEVSYPTP